MADAEQVISYLIALIIILGVLALVFVILAGDYYLTQFSFTPENDNDKRSITMTQTQMEIAQTSVVMRWISLGFVILAGIFMRIGDYQA